MNFKESKERYIAGFGGRKERDKLYNYIIISKIKEKYTIQTEIYPSDKRVQ